MTKKCQPTSNDIYVFIRDYLAEHGYAPSQREIATGCFISQTAVIRHLDRLRAARRIWSTPGKPRSIRLLNPPLNHPSSHKGSDSSPQTNSRTGAMTPGVLVDSGVRDSKRPSKRQAVHDFIREHIAQHGYAPNVREIGQGCGMVHSAAYHHLKRLEAAGKLRWTRGSARSIVLIDEAARVDTGR